MPPVALDRSMPIGGARLRRALAWSALAHVGIVAAIVLAARPSAQVELVDIELAPPPPPVEALPAEVAAPIAEGAAAAEAPAAPPVPVPLDDDRVAVAAIDAGVAPSDAAAAPSDAAVPSPDAPVQVAVAVAGIGSADGSGVGSADGSGTGSAHLAVAFGVPGALAASAGSGVPSTDDEPAVAGAPTTAGTAANLLAYLPPGSILGALVRFDRLRGTEWAARTEALFRAMPDYAGLFGDRDAGIADKIDLLVVGSPRPDEIIATTLVMQTHLARPAIRALLGDSVHWTAARGGMLGTRRSPFPHDRRVVLSPWRGWYVLAQPRDLGGLAQRGAGDPDAAEVTGGVPAWLAQIRSIASESGDGPEGPALVVTIAAPSRTGRIALPEIGLGVASVPVPLRISLAMELVKTGWLVRGNIAFRSAADAAELAQALATVQQNLLASSMISSLLARQHVLDLVKNLSVAHADGRVSYATSLSIADARALLAGVTAAIEP